MVHIRYNFTDNWENARLNSFFRNGSDTVTSERYTVINKSRRTKMAFLEKVEKTYIFLHLKLLFSIV